MDISRASLVRELFGKESRELFNFVGKNQNKGVCKNKHFVYDTPQGLRAVKEFRNIGSATRESNAYNFFKNNRLIQTPQHYYSNERYLITDYIVSNSFNLSLTLSDWSRVHQETIRESSEIIDPIPEAIDKTKKFQYLFGKNYSKIYDIFLEGKKTQISSLTHGDLYCNNVLSTSRGNYYIDFETFGLGHPARDLSLLLFNSNESEKRFILEEYPKLVKDIYSENFKQDINLFLIERLSRIIIGLNNETKLFKKFRSYYLSQAHSHLNQLLN